MKIRSINVSVLIAVMLVLVSIVSVHAAMPGFDCSKATTEVEKLICSDDRLADLDKQMADVFRALLSGLGENEKKAVKKEQNLWLKSRQKMLDASPSREDKLKTLSELYETKITELNLKAELSVKSKSATAMPSAKDICELCRLFSDSTQRLSLLSNTKGSEDINNDGKPEIMVMQEKTPGGPIIESHYYDYERHEIEIERSEDAEGGLIEMSVSDPFRFNNRTYFLKETDPYYGGSACIIYFNPKNEEVIACSFKVGIVENPVPVSSKFKDICLYLKTNKISDASKNKANELIVDIDNDGKKEKIVRQEYDNAYSHYGPIGFSYYKYVPANNDNSKLKLNDFIDQMQEIGTDDLPHGVSGSTSFFDFKGKTYCELNDKEKHVVRIFENGKIHEVCTFERKKVYTLANPCK